MSYELGSRVLYSLRLFEQRGKISFDKKQFSKLSMLFGLSDDELHSQLSALTREHLLEKLPSSGNRTIFKLTNLGNERAKPISDEIGTMTLDGKNQNLPISMDLNELLTRLSDPFEKVLVIEMLMKDRTMDISKVIFLERTNPLISAEDMVLRTLDGKQRRSEDFFHQVFY